MLKTSITNKATPAVLFIAYGVLKGYAKNPFRLFIKILLKVPKLKKQLPKKLAADIKKQAAIIASMYIVIKEEVDKVVFHRNGPSHTIFEGYKYCEFICENKELKQ